MVKDTQKRVKYYEAVRDYAQDLLSHAEAGMKNVAALGDELASEFAKLQKRQRSLLDKASRRMERELKKVSSSKKSPKNGRASASPTPIVGKLPKAKIAKPIVEASPPA